MLCTEAHKYDHGQQLGWILLLQGFNLWCEPGTSCSQQCSASNGDVSETQSAVSGKIASAARIPHSSCSSHVSHQLDKALSGDKVHHEKLAVESWDGKQNSTVATSTLQAHTALQGTGATPQRGVGGFLVHKQPSQHLQVEPRSDSIPYMQVQSSCASRQQLSGDGGHFIWRGSCSSRV